MKITFAPRGIAWAVWMKALFREVCPETVNINIEICYTNVLTNENSATSNRKFARSDLAEAFAGSSWIH